MEISSTGKNQKWIMVTKSHPLIIGGLRIPVVSFFFGIFGGGCFLCVSPLQKNWREHGANKTCVMGEDNIFISDTFFLLSCMYSLGNDYLVYSTV